MVSTPWVVEYFVTMNPCTPRNGTDLHLIFGSWTILKLSPLDLSVSDSHGPVIQKAALPFRNAFFGNNFSTDFFGKSGRTSPFDASSPTQSLAPTMTSGACDGSTVPSLSRMSP